MFKGRTLPLMLVVIMCLDFDLTQEMECPNFLFLAPRPSNNPYFNYLNVLFSIWRVEKSAMDRSDKTQQTRGRCQFYIQY